MPAVELVDAEPPAGPTPIGEDELERLRILARTPRLGRELDDRVMPAEAGLEERAISFTKGCYPGQEPVARLHYRGHPNRGLRVLALDGGELPAYDAELTLDGKVVGRVTSAAPDPEHGVVALAYVPPRGSGDAPLELRRPRGAAARSSLIVTSVPLHSPFPAPVAQGIERCPAEAEVASSNLAGRMRAAEPDGSPAPARILRAWASRTTSSSPSRGARTRAPRRPRRAGCGRAFARSSTGSPSWSGSCWAVRDEDARIVDFAFGYGNPTMLRRFRLTAQDAVSLHVARGAPPMRGSRAFESYVRRLRDRQPWVTEVTYDTPFGDGSCSAPSCTAPRSSATG